MRCEACDTPLSDFEATRKNAKTGQFLDLCNECYAPIAGDIEVVERYDLMKHEDMDLDDLE